MSIFGIKSKDEEYIFKDMKDLFHEQKRINEEIEKIIRDKGFYEDKVKKPGPNDREYQLMIEGKNTELTKKEKALEDITKKLHARAMDLADESKNIEEKVKSMRQKHDAQRSKVAAMNQAR